jgi:hypothetical protein
MRTKVVKGVTPLTAKNSVVIFVRAEILRSTKLGSPALTIGCDGKQKLCLVSCCLSFMEG